jgi:hypothetical protein
VRKEPFVGQPTVTYPKSAYLESFDGLLFLPEEPTTAFPANDQ